MLCNDAENWPLPRGNQIFQPLFTGKFQKLTSQNSLYKPAQHRDVILVTFAIHVLALALPLSLLQVYDRILPNQSWGTTTYIVIGVASAILLEGLLRYGRARLLAALGARYEAEAIVSGFDHLLKADIEAVEKRGTADVQESFRAIGTARDLWSGNAMVALYEIPFVVIYLALIAYIGGPLVFIPAVLFLLALAATWYLKTAIEQRIAHTEVADRERRNFSWATFSGLPELKSRGAEAGASRHYSKLNNAYLASSVRQETLMAWVRENSAFISQLATVLVVLTGAIMVMGGSLTTGALAACTMLTGRAIAPIMGGLGYLTRLSQMRQAEEKVDSLLNLPMLENAGSGAQAKDANGALSIEAPGWLEKPLKMKAGEIVCLTSSDPARIAHLLAAVAGLHHSDEVKVTLGKTPAEAFDHQLLRELMLLVPRQVALVPGSILNNLTLYDPRLNEAVKEVGAELGLDLFVNRLSHGYLSDVGPVGANRLDKGIYRRIALIRALVRQPRYLLIETAALGLDIDGVKRLTGALQARTANTTILLSSSRQEIQDICDRVVEVSAGGEQ